MNNKTRLITVSLLTGAIYPLGFAPFGWWPVAILSVAIIFKLWSEANRSDAIISALFFGLGTYGVGVSWVYVSMANFGGMVPVMAGIAVILFALILSSFYVALVSVYTIMAPKFLSRHRLTVLLPILWVCFEWLRGTVLTGFPWLQLGYSAVDSWLSGWASISGVLTVSLVMTIIAGLIAHHLLSRNFDSIVSTSVVLIALTLLSWGLRSLIWSNPTGEALNVALIQADISLDEKWGANTSKKLMQTYLAASRETDKADLIVWPEGALQVNVSHLPDGFMQQLHSLSAPVLFGGFDYDPSDEQSSVYNALAMVSNEKVQIYRKVHLVPFGEFFPFRPILDWLFASLDMPMSDFSYGSDTQENLNINGVSILPTICYEDSFPEDWRSKVGDAQVILNISEDAWFGDSFAPQQRLQMARMRAIEFQRPIIRVSNSGLSTVIDEQGKYNEISPQFTPAILQSPVFPRQGDTPYARNGQWPLWGWLLLSLGYGLLRSARAKGEYL